VTVTPSKTAAPGRLLKQVAGERQTGALMVGGQPGGAVYVLEGRVVYAESPAAPGVGELLTSSGRLAARTWQNALDVATSTARVGRLLVDQGHLTQGELELCVLGATYDAAYFALADQSAPVKFLAGATHWLGPVVHIDPVAVDKEARRRGRLLAEIFADPRVDVAAVSPAPRAPRERITLTAPQWELLVHADGQRTPADLALLLGRAGFATILQLRRLAAAGLIEVPEVRAEAPKPVRPPRARGTAAPVHPPKIRLDDPPVPATDAGPAPEPSPADPALAPGTAGPPPHAGTPAADEGNANGTVYRPRLARRKPGAKLPKDLATEPPPDHTGTDEVLLTRIRSALRALR
jgi:uncharacterized protein DUF4388